MSQEENLNQHEQQPANFTPTPEAKLPPEQATLRRLLEVIDDKANGNTSANLHAPGDVAHAVYVYQNPTSRDTNQNGSARLGLISYKAFGANGSQNGIEYNIFAKADGLHKHSGLVIEKTIKDYGHREFRGVHFNTEDKTRFATEGVRMIAALLKPAATDSELIPSFVSELEAKTLLTRLNSLVPFEVPRRRYYNQ